jgi:hypothetical protein
MIWFVPPSSVGGVFIEHHVRKVQQPRVQAQRHPADGISAFVKFDITRIKLERLNRVTEVRIALNLVGDARGYDEHSPWQYNPLAILAIELSGEPPRDSIGFSREYQSVIESSHKDVLPLRHAGFDGTVIVRSPT